MCAYEFYFFDKTEKAHFVGILQEGKRRSIQYNTAIYPGFGKEVCRR